MDERVAPAEPREAPGRGSFGRGRSAAAPVLLALTTVTGLIGAVLALLPAAMSRRPAGRLGPRAASEPGPDAGAALEAAADGEPLSR